MNVVVGEGSTAYQPFASSTITSLSTEAAKACRTRGLSNGGCRVLKVTTNTVGVLVVSSQGMSVPREESGRTTDPGNGVSEGVFVGITGIGIRVFVLVGTATLAEGMRVLTCPVGSFSR